MLKLRNIVTIIMVNYIILLFICCIGEFAAISSKAQEASRLTKLAGDMALQQVQATDDFFITGGGYIVDGNKLDTSVTAYSMTVPATNGKYTRVNIFEAVSNKHDIDSIYKFVYGNGKISKFITDNPNVLAVDFTASRTLNLETVDGVDTLPQTFWYKVPSLAQLGEDVTEGKAKKVYTLADANVSTPAVVTDIWTMYDLEKSKKVVNMQGVNTAYYLTPMNVGVTYINEDLVQAFFMNNLDLLMRGKYAQAGDYNLNTETSGYGMLKTSFYPELVNQSTLANMNPINNGSFTLLRGKEINNTGMGVQLYEGMKPKVEYVVIDMYDDKYTDILQLLLGAKTTATAGGGSYKAKPVTGSLLKSLNQSSINRMNTLTGTTGVYDSKPVVVAKVTFYADFVIPYSTVSLREMRGRAKTDGSIGGRYLFDPFSASTLNVDNIQALEGNYVDLATEVDLSKYGATGNKVYRSDSINASSGLHNLGSNSDAFTYTTYFAVTP